MVKLLYNSTLSDELDGTEIIRIPSSGSDQRDSGSHGSPDRRSVWQSAQGQILEGREVNDGKSGRVPQQSEELRQGSYSRECNQGNAGRVIEQRETEKALSYLKDPR